MLTYVSLGAGVQSSALLVMSALGLHGCPRSQDAVFADTQDEPGWVYEHLKALTTWAAQYDVTVHWVTRGRLSFDPVVRVPAFVDGDEGPAPLTQNCTRDYKLTPIRQWARRTMRERDEKQATALIGISLDEADRMKPSRRKWLKNAYPLVDARLRRYDCATLLRSHGLPVPRKSACVFCPWHSGAAWREIQIHDPIGWQNAVAYDERLTRERGASVLRSRIPLREMQFDAQQDLDGFNNECAGVCGV